MRKGFAFRESPSPPLFLARLCLAGDLVYGAPPFADGAEPVLMPHQLGVRESDAAERAADDIARGSLSSASIVKPRLRGHKGVTPAIQNDARNIPARVESSLPEQSQHLFAYLS